MKGTFLIALIIASYHLTFGQTLSGKITDKDNDPLVGAYIANITNGKHAHSDINGNFILEGAKIGDSLQLSYIGHEVAYHLIQSLEDPLEIQLEESTVSLDEVVILPELNALNVITEIDTRINPVNSSQEVLRKVPGLFIGQHAGGGKAEQIFLRGFDIDHGTDITINVDGIPVNMVSHAHGQGYADLHFVIPETIDKIDFGKGPYYADKGNFNTAGYVDFRTKRSLDNSLIKVEAGQFSSYRVLGMFNTINSTKHKNYIAAEYTATDGPFDSPQNFRRVNLFSKYTGKISETDQIGITLSHFNSKWDASGQIPQRSVDDGSITRFGAIDDTEGGNTNRTNLLIDYHKFIDLRSFVRSSVYFSNYNFELYSNFTFFLEDSLNGDQIRQRESRNIIGLTTDYNREFALGQFKGDITAGIVMRTDFIANNELSKTRNRLETMQQMQFGNVHETNLGTYINANFDIGKFRINPALRIDYFDFEYNDALATAYQTQSKAKAIVSPKLNILYNYSRNLQLYLKTGKGFHSNDTRVVVNRSGQNILPAAYGFDAGFTWKPISRLLINVAYWQLYLEQEFVYVGDAGIVEPSGETRRQGFDFSLRYQPLVWLYWNLDANYTHARAIGVEDDEDFIPLAPDFTLVSGLNVIHKSGINGGLNLKVIKDRPANENNSIVAEGYAVVDMNAGYNWKNLGFGIQIQNLFNTEWNETQFATESRLQNEEAPVTEIHFTPGTPFAIKGTVELRF